MMRKHSKMVVLGFIVNSFSSFCLGDPSDDCIREVENILLKPLEGYKASEEIAGDLQLLQKAEDTCVRNGRVWELPISGMNLRRLHLRMLNEENIMLVVGRIRAFLKKKQAECDAGTYVEEINRIYRYHGASDTEERAFYENVIYLKRVRSIDSYASLLAPLDGLFEGVSFWREL
ncbi:MAG: hypothetical protein LBF34_03985 [Puniceicoccales bacterium]|jgi:hypothetical protein|nr:hypothetical protein [Puniceicoccales bacterium]